MIVLMLRGRHRGLPVAIDRAILLPHAYARFDRRAVHEPENYDLSNMAPNAGPQVDNAPTTKKQA
jgi:hypothetical protein